MRRYKNTWIFFVTYWVRVCGYLHVCAFAGVFKKRQHVMPQKPRGPAWLLVLSLLPIYVLSCWCLCVLLCSMAVRMYHCNRHIILCICGWLRMYIFVSVQLRMQFDPRVALSLASAPLICGGKPIPLGELAPKSYDWGYANYVFKCVFVCCSHRLHFMPSEAVWGFHKDSCCGTRISWLDGCGCACIPPRTWEVDRRCNYFPCLYGIKQPRAHVWLLCCSHTVVISSVSHFHRLQALSVSLSSCLFSCFLSAGLSTSPPVTTTHIPSHTIQRLWLSLIEN